MGFCIHMTTIIILRECWSASFTDLKEVVFFCFTCFSGLFVEKEKCRELVSFSANSQEPVVVVVAVRHKPSELYYEGVPAPCSTYKSLKHVPPRSVSVGCYCVRGWMAKGLRRRGSIKPTWMVFSWQDGRSWFSVWLLKPGNFLRKKKIARFNPR